MSAVNQRLGIVSYDLEHSNLPQKCSNGDGGGGGGGCKQMGQGHSKVASAGGGKF